MSLEAWLRTTLSDLGAVAGSVHRREGDHLALAAAVNLPPPVLAAVATVPPGKGMAGLALTRRRAVTTCNLQTDETGDVRPGARAVDAEAAAALPVFDATGEVRAVVGFAFRGERALDDADLARLTRLAAGAPV